MSIDCDFRLPSVLIGLFTMATPAFGQAPNEKPLRVMTFNIRYGTADDGENRWENRKEFLAGTVAAFDPDLLGTQETLKFQRDYIAGQLPAYGAFGVGRDDGTDAGEMTAVFYKKDRFERLDGGHFWLSETPDVPGSKSWDSSLPRMATWLKLRDKSAPEGKPILFVNTHFDHRGREARLGSARLLREKIGELGEGCDVIVTGDFNAGEGSEPYAALFGGGSPVVDVYRAANPKQGEDEGTFSGFRAGSKSGARIDWIGASSGWTVEKAEIDRTAKDGRTPSDHFPVAAVLSRSE